MALKCFVAMALDHRDTDNVYDKLIKVVLRRKGVTPFRVDRREHNEDIDDMIMSELHNCDFALADLTYARPSVYFEAGFAQRATPVIYTCRKDHLRPRANDGFGNFRVHFDLLMKNIIPWSSDTDAKFADKLERRISFVIAPLLRTKKLENERKEKAEMFNSLSVQERIRRIEDLTTRKLGRAGFHLSRSVHSFVPDHKWSWKLLGVNVFARLRKGVISCVLVHFTPSYNYQIFNRFESILYGDPNLTPRDLYGLLVGSPREFLGRQSMCGKSLDGETPYSYALFKRQTDQGSQQIFFVFNPIYRKGHLSGRV